MREGWDYKHLIEVCDFQGGSQPPKEEWSKEPKPNYVRMLQIRDFTQSATDFIEFVKVSKSLKYCQDDDILLGRYGASVGKVLTGLSGAYNVAIIKAIPDVALVSKKYIKSYFLSPGFQLNLGKVSQHRAAQAGFSKDDIADFPIPVPPIAEQEKIVAELDLLSGIIEKQKAQLKELDTLAQSIFYDMFGDPITNEKGWEVRPFKEGVVEMFLGPFGSSLKTDCYVEKESSYCMVYEQKHAIKKSLEVDNHYIDKEKYNSLQRFEVRPGDLIMSCRGTIGEVYELPSNAPIGIIHPSLMKIRLRDGVFGRTFFKTILDKTVKGEDTNGGCVQMAITAKALGNKLVIHPPIDLQNKFAQKIEAIEKQKELIKKSIQETETLFNSRMDYWFN